MVIFRIISNLIRLALGLAMMPFFFALRNVFGIILLLGVGYIAMQSYQADKAVQQSAQHNPHVKKNNTRQPIPSGQFDAEGNPIMIDQVTVVEDGNSSFATDLLTKMTSAELQQYSAQLFWAMDHIHDGKAHQWAHLNIGGVMQPTKTFRNKRGFICRNFDETLKVHEVQQTLKAMACQRQEGGWCKLRQDYTPACNLGRPAPGILEEIGGSISNLF